MPAISGTVFLSDDQVLPTRSYDLSFYEQGPTLYEVFGFQDKKFFFFDDHLERLAVSSSLAHLGIWMDRDAIIRTAMKVIALNHAITGSINISFIFSEPKHFTSHYIAPFEHDRTAREHGIAAGLLQAERFNPTIKFFKPAFRREADKAIIEQNVTEVILVDGEGYITEGSRTNIFLIKENHITTTPVNRVLAGITRRHVIDICKQLGFTIVEKPVRLDELALFDGAFLTGTTSRVLPVRSIGDKIFETGIHVGRRIREAYEEELTRVIAVS
jgi:branched-chain amino acid aminotransferase